MSTQLYLSITQKPRLKSHYRGHRVAIWLDLIPQLHRAGGLDVAMRHHHFHEKGDRYFSGSLRAESPSQFPPVPDFLAPVASPGPGGAHECPPTANMTELAVEEPPEDTVNSVRPAEVEVIATNVIKTSVVDDDTGIFHGFTPSQFFKSSLALGVTLGAGGLLLVLNVVVLVAILYQRARKARQRCRKQDGSLTGGGGAAAGSQEEGLGSLGGGICSMASTEDAATPLTALAVTTLPRTAKQMQNGPLDVLQAHGPHGMLPRYPIGPVPIPVPPPPRGTCPPATVGMGPSLGMAAGPTSMTPRPPGAPKKRVQIQEISV